MTDPDDYFGGTPPIDAKAASLNLPSFMPLSEDVYAAIGRVAVSAAHIEFTLGQIIARLAQVPEIRSYILVSRYGFEGSQRKIDELIAFWRSADLSPDIKSAISRLSDCMVTLKRSREDRNTIIHGLWWGPSPTETPYRPEKLHAIRFRFVGKPNGNHHEWKLININQIYEVDASLLDALKELRAILTILPTVGD